MLFGAPVPVLRDSLLTHILVAWAVLGALGSLVPGLARLPDPLWIAALILAAWPVGLVLGAWAMYRRRADLAYGTEAQSRLRRWLARGLIKRALMMVLALVLVTLLVLAAAQLHWQHWLVLAVLVVVVVWGRAILRERGRGEAQRHAMGYFIDRIPVMAAGTALLAAGLLVLDFAVIERPDLRATDWADVWSIAFADGAEGVRSEALGKLFGAAHAIEMLAWHGAQTAAGALSPLIALGFWLVFPIAAGGFAGLFMLALVAALQHLDRHVAPGARETPLRIHFTALVSVLMAAVVVGHLGLGRELAREAPQPRPTAATCSPAELQDAMAEEATLSRELADVAAGEREVVGARTAQVVDAAFDALDPGIEAYLDWYYSLGGEYTRFGAAVVGDAEGYLRDAFAERVFGDGFETRLGADIERIERDSTQRIGAELDRYQTRLRDAYAQRDCAGARADGLLEPLSAAAPQPGSLPHQAPGAMAGAATAGAVVTARVGASAAARVASGSAFRAGAQAIARAGASRLGGVAAGAGAGAAVCAWSGPFAFACAAAAAGAAWFSIDYGVLRLQEYVQRDEMEAEIRAALDATRAQALEQLLEAQSLRIDAMTAEVAGARHGFVPRRDGIGPR